MARETPQPPDLKTQMIQQFDLLAEMGARPDGKGGLPASQEYYRNKISERSAGETPFISHLYSLNEEPPSIMRRYNTLASLTNLLAAWFVAGHIHYDEFCAFAQAAEYDVLSRYGSVDDVDDYIGTLGSQTGDSEKFFEEFSKLIDKAAEENYYFLLPYGVPINRTQYRMLDTVRNISNANFGHMRNLLESAKSGSKNGFDISSIGAMMSDQREMDKYGIDPNQAALTAQYELDGILSMRQQFKGL